MVSKICLEVLALKSQSLKVRITFHPVEEKTHMNSLCDKERAKYQIPEGILKSTQSEIMQLGSIEKEIGELGSGTTKIFKFTSQRK